MYSPSRREFIFRAGLTGAGVLAFDGLARRCEWLSTLADASGGSFAGYGPLVPTKTNNTGEIFLALPKDFQYTVIGKAGSRMSDGHLTPPAHDGMAAFRVGNQLRLVRNHEVNISSGKPGAAIGPKPYDALAGAGTTTLIVDPITRTIVKDFISLSGTLINCAGGATPWNSWISCEETVLGPTKFKSAAGNDHGGFERPHGYCFEVPAAANKAVDPVPLKAMGRFVHEAIAVDSRTGIVYLTEDLASCGFYRFLPKKQGRLAAGGRLQMLAIKDQANFDTRTRQKIGVALESKWVDIRHPDPPEAELDNLAVYKQGLAAGAATFARLEGCFFGNGRVYFTATIGGDKELGQIWEYLPTGKDQGTLTLLFEVTDPALMQMPDNICLAGQNLVVCEDNGVSNNVRLLTHRGQVFDIARNIVADFGNSELAGVTFSPDAQTLFVNVQAPGMTFAIWGPWDRISG